MQNPTGGAKLDESRDGGDDNQNFATIVFMGDNGNKQKLIERAKSREEELRIFCTRPQIYEELMT
jgi:hypothetical protein